MPASPIRLFAVGIPLVAFGCLGIVLIKLGENQYQLGIGYFLGTLFGQIAAAAIWTAWGPLSLGRRILWAGGWLALLLASVIAQLVYARGNPVGEIFLFFGGLIVAQWLVLQVPLIAFWLSLGVCIRSQEVDATDFDPRNRQFGIQQLIVITTIIAVVLGVGRQVLLWIPDSGLDRIQQNAPSLISLALAAIVMSLPLAIAALLRKYFLICTSIVLLLVSLGTFVELPLLESIQSTNAGHMANDLIWVNIFTSAWVLAFALVVRWSGYRLGSATPAKFDFPQEFASIPGSP